MPKTSFVATDPSFIVVLRAVGELKQNENITHDTIVQVSSNSICGNNTRKSGKYLFKKWYDFTRTAGSVMRLYMLKATDMLTFHDPDLNTIGKERNKDEKIYDKFLGTAINMAADVNEAEYLSAQFDRLYPHYILDNQFRSMAEGDTKSHQGMMFVVDLQNKTLYQVISSLTVTLKGINEDSFMIIEAIPFVTVYKVHLQNLPANFQDLDPKAYKYTRLLQELITEFNNLPLEELQPITDDLQAMNLNDSNEDDEEEEEGQEEQQEEQQGQEE